MTNDISPPLSRSHLRSFVYKAGLLNCKSVGALFRTNKMKPQPISVLPCNSCDCKYPFICFNDDLDDRTFEPTTTSATTMRSTPPITSSLESLPTTEPRSSLSSKESSTTTSTTTTTTNPTTTTTSSSSSSPYSLFPITTTASAQLTLEQSTKVLYQCLQPSMLYPLICY